MSHLIPLNHKFLIFKIGLIYILYLIRAVKELNEVILWDCELYTNTIFFLQGILLVVKSNSYYLGYHF